MEKRTDKYTRIIREGINKASLENISQKREKIQITAGDYSGDFKREAKEIISHIKEAYEEIYLIENSNKNALKTVNQNINNNLLQIFALIDTIINKKVNKIEELKQLVSELIYLVGPLKDSVFLLLNIKRPEFNLIFRHSINVCLISLSIAIELTTMMAQKLNDKSVKGDFKKLNICNSKIFNKDELINLGVTALLHDIGLLEYFSDIDENTKFNQKDKSKIELHINNAFHLLTYLKVDYNIRKAILQHHERIDGSGYPNGIKKHLFNKYSLVLSFADQMELITGKNPFNKRLHPHKAIMYILTKERYKFDNDVTLAYCQAASLYPIGSWLILSNKKIGLVFKTNKSTLKRPIVKCIYTAEMKELLQKEFIDLSKSDLKILELVNIESLELLNYGMEQFLLDEREFKRVSVNNIEGKINFPNTSIMDSFKIMDLSAGGARIEVNSPLKLGDEIFITFCFNNREFNHIKGIIVWANLQINQYGVRFLNVDQNFKQFLFDSI